MYGRKMTDKELHQLQAMEKMAEELFVPGGPGSELDLLPVLRFLPNETLDRIKKLASTEEEWFLDQLRLQLSQYDSENTRSVVDILLKEVEKGETNGVQIKMENVDLITRNLIFAGFIS